MARFILIHGAWHGGWCWERLGEVLEHRGHAVLAPDLPGHGTDPTPVGDVTLQRYVDRVIETMEQLPGAHLVGHSLGGMSVSAAAEQRPDLIRQLIYLCAMAPIDGDNTNAVGRLNVASALPPALVSMDDGLASTVREDALEALFYHDCDAAAQTAAAARLVPQANAVLAAKVALGDNFAGVPKAYIECIEDNAITIAAQRAIWKRAGIDRIATLNTSHSPFLAAPLLLAHTLETLAHEQP